MRYKLPKIRYMDVAIAENKLLANKSRLISTAILTCARVLSNLKFKPSIQLRRSPYMDSVSHRAFDRQPNAKARLVLTEGDGGR